MSVNRNSVNGDTCANAGAFIIGMGFWGLLHQNKNNNNNHNYSSSDNNSNNSNNKEPTTK